MSRRPRAELQFGSDSFLDVVANIVGILIILIVIAGLRVSQTPVLLPVKDALVISPSNEFDELPLDPLIAAEDDQNLSAPLAIVITQDSHSEIATAEPNPEYALKIQQLDAEIQRLTAGRKIATEQSTALRESEAKLKAQFSKLQGRLSQKEQQAQKLTAEIVSRRTSLEQLQATLIQLTQQIQEEERKGPLIETLEHRVTPMSKVVSGHEQHYRIFGNRVSEVPITALSSRVREQIERRKDWLLKQKSHHGEVGPVAGYSMHYEVQRDNLSVLDEVRYGQGMVRISVTSWRIVPGRDLVSETAAEALQRGSRFAESLQTADESTTLTFWVYPDSYSTFRELQRYAHAQGFLVAGRPIPDGIEISGSPNGSKSAGQ